MTLEELVSEEKKVKSQKATTAFLIGMVIAIAIYSATHGGLFLPIILLVLAFQIGSTHSQNLKNVEAEISQRAKMWKIGLGFSGFISSILAIKLFFRKTAYNFFEIMILLCFVMGQAMLLMTLTTFFVGFLGKQLYMIILFVTSFGYMVWAIGQFFDGTKIMSYVKALFAYLIGTVLFYLAIIPIGLTVDFIVKLFK